MLYHLDIILGDIIYVMFWLSFCFVYFIFDKNDKHLKLIDVIAAIVLILFAGLRRNVGSDYYAYYLKFEYYAKLSFSYLSKVPKEKLFSAYCILLGKFSQNPFFGFWVSAFILYTSLIILARKVTKRPSLCVAAYIFFGFYGMSLNILRQIIAMLLVQFVFFSIQKRKYILSIFFSFLAVGIHTSAIIAIFIILFSVIIKPKMSTLVLFLVAGAVLRLLFFPLLSFLCSKIPILSIYAGYLEKIDTLGSVRVKIGILGYIINYTIITVLLIKQRKNLYTFKIYDRIISMLIVALPLSIAGTGMWVLNRIAVYMYQFVVFLMPSLYNAKFQGYTKKFSKFFIFAFLFIWLVFITVFGGENLYNTYTFVWDNVTVGYY